MRYAIIDGEFAVSAVSAAQIREVYQDCWVRFVSYAKWMDWPRKK